MRSGKKSRMKNEEPQENGQHRAVQVQTEECQKEADLIHPDKESEEAGLRNRVRIIIFAAIVIAAAAILIAIGIYRADYSKVITVISTVGDVTFTDKSRDEEGCYVTLTAADYNRIPEERQSGIRIKIDSALYDILVLDVEYDTANIVFEVPQGIARKAGFSQEEMNIKSLWTDEILSRYTSVRSIIWSAEY